MSSQTGWTGRVLCINLTDKSFSVQNPPEKIYHEYIGGRGMAGWYLRPHCTKPWNSPEMPLLFFNGPLVDTESPTSGRFSVMSKSPLTGTVCDSSAGGKFGTELKRAGWDGIVITGSSNDICGVLIDESMVKFSAADHLTGKLLSEIFLSLPAGGSSAAVGQASENGVLYSNISFDGISFAGRGGLGLVMAAKGLKYIHVEGSGKTGVFNRDELLAAREDILRLTAASPVLMGELGFTESGTGALYDLIHSRRMMPADNFRKTQFDSAPEMNAWNYKKRYETVKTGCSGCHIQCKRVSIDGARIPDYETMSHFSALIGNKDIEKVMDALKICNESGMDTLSAASAIACYMEINDKDCNKTDFIKLLKDISMSRGEGDVLKLGSFRYASMSGKPEFSMSVKSMDIPAYDPRGAYGMALAYAVSTRGACHMKANPVSHEILRKPVATDRFSFSGKARITKLAEDMNAAADSLTACRFIFFAVSLEEYSRAFRAVTGLNINGTDLIAAGERICYNERIMNFQNGFSSKDDDLPERFFNLEGTSGDGIKIPPVSRDEFLETRNRYYRIRGLTPQGNPTKEKCEELDLEWIN